MEYLVELQGLFAKDPLAAAVARCVARVFGRPRAASSAGLAELSRRRPGVGRVPTQDEALAGRVARAFRKRPCRPRANHGDLGSRRLGIVRG